MILKTLQKLISELKQKEYKFKIIRHKNKKNAFFKNSLAVLRKTNALLDGHFVLSSGLHSTLHIYSVQNYCYPNKSKKFTNL